MRSLSTDTVSADLLPAELLSSGEELLMRAARVRVGDSDVERIREICSGEIDWSATIDSANHHGVASLLHTTLSRVAADLVPRPALDRLSAGFASTAIFNLHLTRELLDLLDLLVASDIPALPYKGPVLASFAYGNLALRQFADIDILVPSGRLWDVDAIVRDRGYSRKGGESGGVLPSEGQFLYEQESGSATIELHWELAQKFYSFPFDFTGLWQRRMMVAVGGREVATFGFEDTVVTLALHHTKHRWERLIWICDFAELVRSHQEREWESVIAYATSVGSARAVLLGFHLASTISGAALPTVLRLRIESDPEVVVLAGEVIEGIIRGGGEYSAISERVGFNIQARERIVDRLRFGWRRLTVPTSTDRSAVRLPATLDSLYYLVRPIRLLLEHLKSIVRGHS